MILFLNFAPIDFMGGAEKWMNQTAKKISPHEDTLLISTAPEIGNLYGKLVLKRDFKKRSDLNIQNHIPISYSSLIPFSRNWKKLSKSFRTSRLIYTKYELPEILIILYFGGIASFKKTIAGIHSPFLYNPPDGFFGNLHNFIYGSSLNSKLLSFVKKVHVLNRRDEEYMTKDLKLENVRYVPNGTEKISANGQQKTVQNKNVLNILTVGELSKRKGTDILLKIVKNSPDNFKFTVIGDGPMKDDLDYLQIKNPKLSYKGFIKAKDIGKYYNQNDVLLLPSRAESMSLVLLEAMAHGLTILNSRETSLGLDKKVEISIKDQKAESYINMLNKILAAKKTKNSGKEYIQNYFSKNFSLNIIYPQLFKNIFELNI